MIKFSQNKLKAEFENLDVRLIHIACALAGALEYEFSKDLVITSVFRTDLNSTHGHWRAFDARVKPKWGKAIYTDKELEFIKAFCSHYLYGNDKKTLFIHDAGSGLHLHVQVPSGDTIILTKVNNA